MLRQILSQLVIELDKTVHSDGDGGSFKDHDPDVTECGRERGCAVAFEELSNHGDEGKEHADETVLVDANVDDLSRKLVCAAKTFTT